MRFEVVLRGLTAPIHDGQNDVIEGEPFRELRPIFIEGIPKRHDQRRWTLQEWPCTTGLASQHPGVGSELAAARLSPRRRLSCSEATLEQLRLAFVGSFGTGSSQFMHWNLNRHRDCRAAMADMELKLPFAPVGLEEGAHPA